MTRINVIPPAEMHVKHVAAEHYELPEIFMLVRRQQAKGATPAKLVIPPTYRYGTGHKTFFYDKLSFLAWRHMDLRVELMARGYKLKPRVDFAVEYCELLPAWWGDWVPPPDAIELNKQRIAESLAAMASRDAARRRKFWFGDDLPVAT